MRLATSALARGVGAAATAVAFLVLAVGLALLAESYRATLARGERDQAAYRVPAEIVVREDLGALVRVLDAAPLARYRSLVEAGAAFPVLRTTASAGRSESISGVTLLGLPAPAVDALSIWRDDWKASRSELRAALEHGGVAEIRGAALRGRGLELEVGPTLLGFRAVVVSRSGHFRTIELGAGQARRTVTLRKPLPRGTDRLLALELVPPKLEERGADAGVALRGRVLVTLSGSSLTGFVGQGGVSVSSARDARRGVQLTYVVTRQRPARIRAMQATDTAAPAVVVTPALGRLAGGIGGLVPIRVAGAVIGVRVTMIVERFPGTSGEAVVGPLSVLATAIDADAPGGGRISEVWLDPPPGQRAAVEAALGRAPFRALETVTRAGVEADARRDPLGHGTLLALLAAAVVALLLGVVGLVLAVRADLRDDAGELAELEAQGASPSVLRRVVRLRASIVGVVGLAGGLVAGGSLALLVTRVVRVTARATAPEPPLQTTLDLAVVGLGGTTIALLAVALVAQTTRAAFADPRGPGRLGGGH